MMLKDKRRLVKFVIIAAAIVAAVVLVVVIQRTHNRTIYDRCVELALEGNWQDTIDTFQSLSNTGYEASREFYSFCQALKCYDEGNIKDACDKFYNMYFSKVTHDQRMKMLRFSYAARDAYKRKYGAEYPPVAFKPIVVSADSSDNSNSHSGSSSQKPKSDSDPYNTKDYAHPDDFYDYYVDDFWDFEDAEDYYYEHEK